MICMIPDCVLIEGHEGYHKPQCMLSICAFEYGHGGPHGMNGLDYHPELPRLTPEEEEVSWDWMKKIDPERFKDKWMRNQIIFDREWIKEHTDENGKVINE